MTTVLAYVCLECFLQGRIYNSHLISPHTLTISFCPHLTYIPPLYTSFLLYHSFVLPPSLVLSSSPPPSPPPSLYLSHIIMFTIPCSKSQDQRSTCSPHCLCQFPSSPAPPWQRGPAFMHTKQPTIYWPRSPRLFVSHNNK